MMIRPMADRLLVAPTPPKERLTETLYLPTPEPSDVYLVIACGPKVGEEARRARVAARIVEALEAEDGGERDQTEVPRLLASYRETRGEPLSPGTLVMIGREAGYPVSVEWQGGVIRGVMVREADIIGVVEGA